MGVGGGSGFNSGAICQQGGLLLEVPLFKQNKMCVRVCVSVFSGGQVKLIC